jgi:hypothetical protein
VYLLTTGIKNTLHVAAAILAKAVLVATLDSLVLSNELRSIGMPVLAAVSPNRDNGAIIRAGITPL